jgi:hypothetical protein
MITLFFIQNSDLDVNGQVKSKAAAIIILFTILIDTFLSTLVINTLT